MGEAGAVPGAGGRRSPPGRMIVSPPVTGSGGWPAPVLSPSPRETRPPSGGRCARTPGGCGSPARRLPRPRHTKPQTRGCRDLPAPPPSIGTGPWRRESCGRARPGRWGHSHAASWATSQGAMAMATTGLFSGAPAADPKLVAEAGELKDPPPDAAREEPPPAAAAALATTGLLSVVETGGAKKGGSPQFERP